MILKTDSGRIITQNLQIALSPIQQLSGLLDPQNSRFLLFKTRFGIHTFFMKKSIDVIVLDNSNTIVKLKQNLPPNRLFFWDFKYSTLIETPQDTINKYRLQLKQTLQID